MAFSEYLFLSRWFEFKTKRSGHYNLSHYLACFGKKIQRFPKTSDGYSFKMNPRKHDAAGLSSIWESPIQAKRISEIGGRLQGNTSGSVASTGTRSVQGCDRHRYCIISDADRRGIWAACWPCRAHVSPGRAKFVGRTGGDGVTYASLRRRRNPLDRRASVGPLEIEPKKINTRWQCGRFFLHPKLWCNLDVIWKPKIRGAPASPHRRKLHGNTEIEVEGELFWKSSSAMFPFWKGGSVHQRRPHDCDWQRLRWRRSAWRAPALVCEQGAGRRDAT